MARCTWVLPSWVFDIGLFSQMTLSFIEVCPHTLSGFRDVFILSIRIFDLCPSLGGVQHVTVPTTRSEHHSLVASHGPAFCSLPSFWLGDMKTCKPIGKSTRKYPSEKSNVPSGSRPLAGSCRSIRGCDIDDNSNCYPGKSIVWSLFHCFRWIKDSIATRKEAVASVVWVLMSS